MKTALLMTAILLVLACRKPQAVFQKSNSESSTELPRKFNFKINPIKLKSKTFRFDSTYKITQSKLSQKIDNQLFVNEKIEKLVTISNNPKSFQKKIIIPQKVVNPSIPTLSFVLALVATLLFAVAVSVNFLIVGGGISSLLWTISGILGLVSLKKKELFTKNQIRLARIGLIISFLALLMILITSLVLASRFP